ncbi:PAP2-domain-containing protein [Stereum hirsutum FP-91666 SS1]|uniref:PAP2-domain-containing protein n=1 Tax=Stereum hirsutum (strain FP-91666) TaxID=721885 RepID=UPI00044496B4|nr:PAP2-domain-containing protein [Stereum hirsutum FP-91666 SS1]EIM82870.1 PAP2-domain-containing protein [Stereum hirsutum FP-91666 SS1]
MTNFNHVLNQHVQAIKYPGRKLNSTIGTRRRRLLVSYAPDWIITIVILVVFFSLNNIHGFKRVFSINDESLHHPFTEHERVPPEALFVIALIAPIVLQWILNFITIRSWWDAHNSTLGVFLSFSLAGVITQFTKITVGRPRPDLIARCNPDPTTVNPPLGLVSVDVCHQENALMLEDGFRSFPSGHSSMSFAGLGFLTLYLAGKLHLFDARGHAPKAWLALTPLAGAALVAISRTMDYRHHWHDIVVGSALGLATAYFSYRQYYPSLASEFSHRPYGPRVKNEEDDPILPQFNDDMDPERSPLYPMDFGESYRDDDDGAINGALPRRNDPAS